MIRTLLVAVAVSVIAASSVVAPDIAAHLPTTADPALAPFERRIGGRWHLGADSYHTFEWGFGGRSVIAEGHFITAGGDKRVS